MRKCIITFTLFVLVFVLTHAPYAQEQYQTEIATTYRKFDSWGNRPYSPFLFTQPTENRTVAYGVAGEAFFAPVNTTSHLFAEAAFLERTGSVFFRLEREEQRLRALLGSLEGTGPVLNLAVKYARSGFPLTAQASFEKSKMHFKAGNIVDMKTDRYGIKVGDYFMNGLLAGVGFDRTKTNALSGPFFIVNSDVLDYQLFLKYVNELERGGGIKFEAKIGWSRITDDQQQDMQSSTQSMSIVYYWSRAASTGIGVQNTGGAVAVPQGKTYTASIDYFISPRYSINGAYDRFRTSNNVYGDSDAYNLTLAARF